MSTSIDAIYSTYESDLRRLNERISRQLECANPLMTQVVKSHLRTKGKQLRPLMVMLCASMFGPVSEKVLAAAASVELLHNASLIHDDVVDNAMTRRGRPTINSVWDNHIAVLVGDYFTTAAMQQALETADLAIVDAICSLGRKLSIGEIDQIYTAREHLLSADSYYAVIDYKTASLFVASAEMGCLASGVADSRKDALSEFAHLFGRCFQLRDDVFDYFDSAVVGKPTGNDLREGKISLPLIHAINNGPDTPAREEARRMIEREELSDEEIAALQAFARDNGGIDHAFAEMRRLRDKAVALLDHSKPQSAFLADLFDFIIDRNY